MENWFLKNIIGYDLLSAEERESIKYFSILWSFFENYVMDTNASFYRIQQKMTEWDKIGPSRMQLSILQDWGTKKMMVFEN